MRRKNNIKPVLFSPFIRGRQEEVCRRNAKKNKIALCLLVGRQGAIV
jgi:hypothetical protein